MSAPSSLPLVFDAPRRGKPPRHLADMDSAERRDVVAALGQPSYRADQLSRHYFARLVDEQQAMTDLPADTRGALVDALLPRLLTDVRTQQCDSGATRKTLWRVFGRGPPRSGPVGDPPP